MQETSGLAQAEGNLSCLGHGEGVSRLREKKLKIYKIEEVASDPLCVSRGW